MGLSCFPAQHQEIVIVSTKKPPEPPKKPTAPPPKPAGPPPKPTAPPAKPAGPPPKPPEPPRGPPEQPKKVPEAPPSGYVKWKGPGCGYIYDESKGDPSRGIRPGTKFMDLPESWICPMCKAPRKTFQKVP